MRQITGAMIYYLNVCERKLWLFSHYIEMEQASELVAIGKFIDKESFGREKHDVLVNGVMSADFLRSGSVVHEVKKRSSITEADLWQIKFYLYQMSLAGIEEPHGVLHYMEDHKCVEISLSEEDAQEVKTQIKRASEIEQSLRPPAFVRKPICKNCAYLEYCAS